MPDEKTNPFVETHQAERIEAKKERCEARAETAAENANALHARASKMASVIPFGQPILVGHHSEKRDRNYRGKIRGTYDKSFEQQKRAESLAERAETIGTGGISSTAPDALTELQAKLERLVKHQDFMKLVNKQFKKGGIDAIDCMSDEAKAKAQADLSKGWRSSDRIFESYSLTNNNAKIRTAKKRLYELERLRNTEAPEIETDDFKMFVAEGKVQFEFTGKPNEEARSIMKGSGRAFKWSRYSQTWVRKATRNAVAAGEMISDELQKLDKIY